MSTRFTEAELTYMRTQRLARLATVDGHGAPQNNPVGFFLQDDGTILIGGRGLGSTRKFRNITDNPNVALVVDDLASVDPWVVRGVEIRGQAQALLDVDPPRRGMSREVIRIVPDWIGSWGVEPAAEGLVTRQTA